MAKAARVAEALAWLEKQGSKKTREEALTRYGITAPKSFGVAMGDIQALAKALGRDHDLAAQLWGTGWYEARLLCAYVDDPAKVSVAQMDRWARDFDNWGICDTVCFKLFDSVPGVWSRIEPWSKAKGEYEKRTAFALMACMSLHGQATDAQLMKGLALARRPRTDERNFVRKFGELGALRSIGGAARRCTRDVGWRSGSRHRKTRPRAPSARRAARPQQGESEDQVKQGIRKDGDFCWINMITPQPKEAMAFFGEVLGWTFFDMGGIGHGIRVGESRGRPLRPRRPADAARNEGPHRRDGEGEGRRRHRREGEGARRRGASRLRHLRRGPHGRLPRSQRRGLRPVAAEEPQGLRRELQRARGAELVREPHHRPGAADGFYAALQLAVRGDEDASTATTRRSSWATTSSRGS